MIRHVQLRIRLFCKLFVLEMCLITANKIVRIEAIEKYKKAPVNFLQVPFSYFNLAHLKFFFLLLFLLNTE
jgi:hypothetical protein